MTVDDLFMAAFAGIVGGTIAALPLWWWFGLLDDWLPSWAKRRG